MSTSQSGLRQRKASPGGLGPTAAPSSLITEDFRWVQPRRRQGRVERGEEADREYRKRDPYPVHGARMERHGGERIHIRLERNQLVSVAQPGPPITQGQP